MTRPIESWCWIDKQLSSLDESLVARSESTEMRPFLPLAFVRVVAKSSLKIATCALAPKMCDTSRRFWCHFSRAAFVLVRPCGCYFFPRPRRPPLGQNGVSVLSGPPPLDRRLRVKPAAGLRQVCGGFAAGLRRVCGRFAAGLRQVRGRFAADLRQVCGRLRQVLRQVAAGFAAGFPMRVLVCDGRHRF